MINIYIGIDGVLSKYNSKVHDMNKDQSDISYNDDRFFQNAEVDEKMIKVAKKLLTFIYDTKRQINIGSLNFVSSISNKSSDALLQCQDKTEWLLTNVTITTDSRFVPSATKKADVISTRLGRKLTPRDILIDDFNEELNAWSEAGGTAIKYINDVNTKESYNGLYLDKAMTSEQIIDYIKIISSSFIAPYNERGL
jgi:hypothetical protein